MMLEKLLPASKMEDRLFKQKKRSTGGRTPLSLPGRGPGNRKTVGKKQKNYDELLKLPPLSVREGLRLFLSRYLICLGSMVGFFHLFLLTFSLVMGLMLSLLNPPCTSLMIHRIIHYGFKPKPVHFLPLTKISPRVQNLVVRLEDQHFYSHLGIDIEALQNAYKLNKIYKRTISGGSTIPMQLTRTLFLDFDKNYFRKYVEIIMALVLDTVMDKKRILELYFNYIEWGKGVYGIEAAAHHHYRKPYSKLNMDEICRLLTIISSPVKYDVKTFVRNKSMLIRYNYLTGSH